MFYLCVDISTLNLSIAVSAYFSHSSGSLFYIYFIIAIVIKYQFIIELDQLL